MKKRIVVVGSLNCDMFLEQSRLPMCGETYVCNKSTMAGGGKGVNQAVQAAKLNCETWMLGAVGKDPLGDFLLAECKKYGVHTEFIQQLDGTSGLGVVQYLPDGSVYATISEGANGGVTPERVQKAETCLAQADAIMLQFEIPLETVDFVLDYARDKGIPTVLNAAPAKEGGRKTLAKAACLMMNESEASYFLGEAIDNVESVERNKAAIQALNPHRVIITLGSKGSVLLENQSIHHIKPTGRAKVVETTGAGDSYAGAYTVRRLMGDDPLTACHYAARAAELTISRIGAQCAMPTWWELERE